MDRETLKRLGVTWDISSKVETIDELRSNPPGMVIGVANRDFHFRINNGEPEAYKRNTGKVLSLYLYNALEKTKESRKKQLKPAKVSFKKIYNPYMGQDLTNQKILIWRTGGIGDLCFIQPLLRWMKKKYKGVEIYFSCSPIYKPLVENWDCIDKLIPFPVDSIYLRKCKYHATFEGVIERCKQAEKENAFELFAKWLGIDDIPKDMLHAIIPTKPKIDKEVDLIMKENGWEDGKFIVAQLRASSPIRTPSSNMWKNIFIPLVRDGYKLIITDGPHAADRIDAFIQISFPEDIRKNVFNFARHSTTIDRTISLIKRAGLVIAPDSSLVHLSEGVSTPVLGIYGAFRAGVRLSTYKHAVAIEPPESDVCDYKGRGCFTHGHRPCKWTPVGKCVPCYDQIDTDEAVKKAYKLLKRENIDE